MRLSHSKVTLAAVLLALISSASCGTETGTAPDPGAPDPGALDQTALRKALIAARLVGDSGVAGVDAWLLTAGGVGIADGYSAVGMVKSVSYGTDGPPIHYTDVNIFGWQGLDSHTDHISRGISAEGRSDWSGVVPQSFNLRFGVNAWGLYFDGTATRASVYDAGYDATSRFRLDSNSFGISRACPPLPQSVSFQIATCTIASGTMSGQLQFIAADTLGHKDTLPPLAFTVPATHVTVVLKWLGSSQ
ncbi:MAG TPA: hypothetical protein VFN83_09710 [Gemmatimonadales bacterium]|jgi:hypothetical protein|nr:hypothetical protein [Gemmatimonadales bacterium]